MILTPRVLGWPRRLGLALAAACAAGGLLLTSTSCVGASESADVPVGPRSQPIAQPALTGGPIPAGLVDPCSLLTTNEVATMSGIEVLDGVRDADEDGTFVVCRWYAADDDLKIAAVVDLTLFVVNDEMKANIQSDIVSGKGEKLAGIGENTEVQAVDLGVQGNSYAAGWKTSAFYRLQCNPVISGGKPSKAICTDAVTAVAGRLP